MDKISLIIPVYNGADTLERCLNSVITQTYQNLEVLLVNDGSTDRSFDICSQFAEHNQQIRLVNQTNAGRNIARNHGIELATGEFISFMDQDDYLDPNYFTHLHEQAEKFNSDIAICDYKFFDVKTPNQLASIPSPYKDKAAGVYETRNWLTKYGEFYRTIDIPVIVPWAKIIRRSCTKNVRFPNDRSLAEDIKTMWKFYLSAKRISYQTNADYINQQHPNSPEKLAAMMYGSVKALEEQITYLTCLNIDVSAYYPVYDHYLHMAQDFSRQLGDYDIYENVSYKIKQQEKYDKKNKN